MLHRSPQSPSFAQPDPSVTKKRVEHPRASQTEQAQQHPTRLPQLPQRG
jgi:hypothetical protein